MVVLARAIINIKPDVKEIYTTRVTPHSGMHAFSHRWEDREDVQTYKDEEVQNLLEYLEKFNELWLDYICINQNSIEDKVAQVGIMGQNYDKCTTLVVGRSLRPEMPTKDYLNRAWCLQERHFGYCKFPWNFDECEPDYLKRFAREVLGEVPHIGGIFADKVEDPLGYGEEWRLDNVQNLHSHYPEITNLIDEAKDHMIKSREDPSFTVEVAKCCLKMREKIDLGANHEVDIWRWQAKMFECDATFAKDRLFGVWCVPLYKKGYSLPYDDVPRAWSMVKNVYPQAHFAFPSPLSNPKAYYNGKALLTNVEDLILSGMNESGFEEAQPTESAFFPIQHGRVKVTWFSSRGENYLAFSHESSDDYLLIIDENIFKNEHNNSRIDGTLCHVFEKFMWRLKTNYGVEAHWADMFDLPKDILVKKYGVPRSKLA